MPRTIRLVAILACVSALLSFAGTSLASAHRTSLPKPDRHAKNHVGHYQNGKVFSYKNQHDKRPKSLDRSHKHWFWR